MLVFLEVDVEAFDIEFEDYATQEPEVAVQGAEPEGDDEAVPGRVGGAGGEEVEECEKAVKLPCGELSLLTGMCGFCSFLLPNATSASISCSSFLFCLSEALGSGSCQ